MKKLFYTLIALVTSLFSTSLCASGLSLFLANWLFSGDPYASGIALWASPACAFIAVGFTTLLLHIFGNLTRKKSIFHACIINVISFGVGKFVDVFEITKSILGFIGSSGNFMLLFALYSLVATIVFFLYFRFFLSIKITLLQFIQIFLLDIFSLFFGVFAGMCFFISIAYFLKLLGFLRV